MHAAHANHHTCYGMKTHNEQKGIEAKRMAIWIHDMQIFASEQISTLHQGKGNS
jgi:hypothetical protein